MAEETHDVAPDATQDAPQAEATVVVEAAAPSGEAVPEASEAVSADAPAAEAAPIPEVFASALSDADLAAIDPIGNYLLGAQAAPPSAPPPRAHNIAETEGSHSRRCTHCGLPEWVCLEGAPCEDRAAPKIEDEA